MNCINSCDLKNIVRCALEEDIGLKDITTLFLVPADKRVKAVILAKEPCVVSGLQVAALVFRMLDKGVKFNPRVKDGDSVKKGKVIAAISGRARALLSAERVALNFLSLLCGISTQTRRFTEAVKPYKARILDTRKTIPGLRILEKYAVRIGGGFNHRTSLDEMVLIKDNHIAASCLPAGKAGAVRRAPCVRELIRAVRKKKIKNMKLEVEVKNLREFKEALKEAPDIIMLDNMSAGDIRKALRIRRTAQNSQRKTQLEASGGITLKNVEKIASTGVDMISVGALSHSVKSVDISLEIL